MSKQIIAFSDVHIPYHENGDIRILLYAIAWRQPQEVICAGDLLDCEYWGKYTKTFGSSSPYTHEECLEKAIALFQAIQMIVPKAKLVFLEGNHEHRIYRWCAENLAGESIYPSLSIQRRLLRAIPGIVYIPFADPKASGPSYYAINKRTIVVHGWSCGKYALFKHLEGAQGMSIVFGHTHRGGVVPESSVRSSKKLIYTLGLGCLCRRPPHWKTNKNVNWVGGFGLVSCGDLTDTLTPVFIDCDRATLDGKVGIRANGYEPIGKKQFTTEELCQASLAASLAQEAIAHWERAPAREVEPQKPTKTTPHRTMVPVSICWGPH